MGNATDLTGRRYGRLTVTGRDVDYVSPKGKRATRWNCRCDCGMLRAFTSTSLRSGTSRSCGCLRREVTAARKIKDLAGQRFGMLVVAERIGSQKFPGGRSASLWRCICDCGSESEVNSANLRGGTKSCGCLGIEVPSYGTMHNWVRLARGLATAHSCADCGQAALEWSCSRDAQHVTDDKGRYYSLDVDDYDARCKPCHAAYDRKTVPIG